MLILKLFMLQPVCANHLAIQAQRKGIAVLLSVLIFGAVGIAVVIAGLLLGVGSSRTSLALQQSVQAKALANACAEEALQTLRESIYYTGNETLTFSQGTCEIQAIGGNGNVNRTVTTVGTVGTVGTIQRTVQVEISAIHPTISITSWQETP